MCVVCLKYIEKICKTHTPKILVVFISEEGSGIGLDKGEDFMFPVFFIPFVLNTYSK